jgi:hypothetical protein
MRTLLAVAVLVLAAPIAHAERSATFSLGGMIGGVEHRVDETTQMQPAGGPRLTLSFEHPQPNGAAGTTADVTLVPELTAAVVMDADRGDALVGVGARGEVRIAHAGIRVAFYAAGRALIIGSTTDPAGEFAIGEYVYLTKRLRLGGEGSLILRRSDEFMATSGQQHGIMASAYLGFAM